MLVFTGLPERGVVAMEMTAFLVMVVFSLVGGVLYAFSSFVMSGLRQLPPAQGMAAMQSINVTAVRPGLMIPFFGTIIASVAVAVVPE